MGQHIVMSKGKAPLFESNVTCSQNVYGCAYGFVAQKTGGFRGDSPAFEVIW